MKKIGMFTIGQSPRNDIVPLMREYIHGNIEILEMGALDDLALEEVKELTPGPGDGVLVSQMRDGTEVKLTKKKILSRLQRCVDTLVREGAELIVPLCTGSFPELTSPVLMLNTGQLLRNAVLSLIDGRRLGVISPSADQVPKTPEAQKNAWGGIDVVITSASPYTEGKRNEKEWRQAGEFLKERKVDLVYLNCMGMDRWMKRLTQEITGKPAILSNAVIARIIDEVVDQGALIE
ncbi:MAG: AroM family protein [Candidatus Tectomicrobia bacterium]|nr:AroM family protein [Candidatus Tectomicrobia bacterium]